MNSCKELTFRIADTIEEYGPDDEAIVVVACLRIVGCYLQKVAREESQGDGKKYDDLMSAGLLMSAGQLADIIRILDKSDDKVMH